MNANLFKLKPALIGMLQQNQFGGDAVEDLNAHLAMVLEICIHQVKWSTKRYNLSLFVFILPAGQG